MGKVQWDQFSPLNCQEVTIEGVEVGELMFTGQKTEVDLGASLIGTKGRRESTELESFLQRSGG